MVHLTSSSVLSYVRLILSLRSRADFYQNDDERITKYIFLATLTELCNFVTRPLLNNDLVYRGIRMIVSYLLRKNFIGRFVQFVGFIDEKNVETYFLIATTLGREVKVKTTSKVGIVSSLSRIDLTDSFVRTIDLSLPSMQDDFDKKR